MRTGRAKRITMAAGDGPPARLLSFAQRKRALDRLAREVTFLRAGHKCQRCEKRYGLQWCHVFSRRYVSLRWHRDNNMCLCSGCHLWWHHQPAAAVPWWESVIGKDAMQALRVRMLVRDKVDMEAERVALEVERARYE